MQVRWTLEIEKFGRIDKAAIEISPFMLFVGDNNSGKSYVMSLLWGILTEGRSILFPQTVPTGKTYKQLDAWLQKQLQGDRIEVDNDTLQLFVKWFNQVLNSSKEALVERVFGFPLSIGSVKLRNVQQTDTREIQLAHLAGDIRLSFPGGMRLILPAHRRAAVGNTAGFELAAGQRLYVLLHLTVELCLGSLGRLPFAFRGRAPLSSPLYLPASRTGFMLSLKTLTQNLISQRLEPLSIRAAENSSTDETNGFPLPVSRFLQALVGVELNEQVARAEYRPIIEMLEHEIMRGQIVRDASPVPNFLYRPDGGSQALPLSVTSSLVTELSPILVFLKSGATFPLMIIEEPEAHLHPHMQRMMARALARLVNLGLPVWITTHSDTLFQQVNLQIQLQGHPERDTRMKQLGYVPEDLLAPDQVRAYQFTVREDGHTQVEALPCGPYGFTVETFNSTIAALTAEALSLQEADADAE